MKPKPTTLPPVQTHPWRSRVYDADFIAEMERNPGEWFYVEQRPTRPALSWAKEKIPGLRIATRKAENGEGYDVFAMIEQ